MMAPHTIRTTNEQSPVVSQHALHPSWTFFGWEPLRAACEYVSMQFMEKVDRISGDGHPVVIFPGLASDKSATAPLTSFCKGLGYEVHDWGRGFNTGPLGDVDDWLDELAPHIAALASEQGRGMSLIGWSLGGIYAREVAKRLPRVRQVITIGTPFAGSAAQTSAGLIHGLVRGQEAPIDEPLARRLGIAPDVPTTSIYSHTDGIVAWEACIQAGTRRTTENIEVDGSHLGLGWNPAVLSIVADRLSQPDGAWKPYGARDSI